jgi:endonuclease/exonuclease/phosphatase family metal-dependent hydrolase
MPHFQLCSYNILSQNYISHSLQHGIAPSHCEWGTRKQQLEHFLSKQQDSVIIGLQEVEENFCDDLEKVFTNHKSFYERRQHKTEGLMLFVHQRCIVEKYSKIFLFNTKGTSRRVVQIVDCIYERNKFRIIHIHLDYDPIDKKDGFEQMKAVLRSYKLRSPLPTLIFGDFNAPIGHQTTEFITNDGFLCVDTSKPTCYHDGTWSRVDHIFHTPQLQISNISIPTIRSKSIPSSIWGSDHLPITCQVEVSQ